MLCKVRTHTQLWVNIAFTPRFLEPANIFMAAAAHHLPPKMHSKAHMYLVQTVSSMQTHFLRLLLWLHYWSTLSSFLTSASSIQWPVSLEEGSFSKNLVLNFPKEFAWLRKCKGWTNTVAVLERIHADRFDSHQGLISVKLSFLWQMWKLTCRWNKQTLTPWEQQSQFTWGWTRVQIEGEGKGVNDVSAMYCKLPKTNLKSQNWGCKTLKTFGKCHKRVDMLEWRDAGTFYDFIRRFLGWQVSTFFISLYSIFFQTVWSLWFWEHHVWNQTKPFVFFDHLNRVYKIIRVPKQFLTLWPVPDPKLFRFTWMQQSSFRNVYKKHV